MSPVVNLVFNIIIIAALGATIYYCIRLSRQFAQMQADRRAFEALIQSLNVASARAEAAIRSLKEAALGSGGDLQEKIGNARAIFDELEIMIQAGDSLANRLQALAEKARRASGVADDQSTEELTATADPGEQQPRTRAEKELLEALRAKRS